MELKNLTESVKKLKQASQKRNFKQRIELIITLTGLELKKPEQQVDFFTTLHHETGRKAKVCGFVGPELLKQAKEAFDEAISSEDFAKYGKKEAKKLARQYDYFVAQVTIMPQVAKAFGTVLGPKGKMPNPKAGCVIAPNANLKQLQQTLQKLARIKAKTQLMVQAAVGMEDSKEEETAENIHVIYDQLVHHLPGEKNNIRRVYIKTTMGKPLRLDDKGNAMEDKKDRQETAQKAEEPKKEREKGEGEAEAK